MIVLCTNVTSRLTTALRWWYVMVSFQVSLCLRLRVLVTTNWNWEILNNTWRVRYFNVSGLSGNWLRVTRTVSRKTPFFWEKVNWQKQLTAFQLTYVPPDGKNPVLHIIPANKLFLLLEYSIYHCITEHSTNVYNVGTRILKKTNHNENVGKLCAIFLRIILRNIPMGVKFNQAMYKLRVF